MVEKEQFGLLEFWVLVNELSLDDDVRNICWEAEFWGEGIFSCKAGKGRFLVSRCDFSRIPCAFQKNSLKQILWKQQNVGLPHRISH